MCVATKIVIADKFADKMVENVEIIRKQWKEKLEHNPLLEWYRIKKRP